eukprot:2882370-Pyramimonas_sp.AAC.1
MAQALHESFSDWILVVELEACHRQGIEAGAIWQHVGGAHHLHVKEYPILLKQVETPSVVNRQARFWQSLAVQ